MAESNTGEKRLRNEWKGVAGRGERRHRIAMLSFFFEVQFTNHKIHPSKVYNSTISNIFPRLCHHHHCLVPEHSHCHEVVILYSSLTQALATTHLSVSVGLPIVGISHKWNHILCGPYVCILLLVAIFLRFIHVVACFITSFLLIE